MQPSKKETRRKGEGKGEPRELLRQHVERLTRVLASVEALFLRHRNALSAFRNLYNVLATSETDFQRAYDVLGPHSGIADDEAVRRALLVGYKATMVEQAKHLRGLEAKLDQLHAGEDSELLQRHGVDGPVWNIAYLAHTWKALLGTEIGLATAIGKIKFIDHVPVKSLYDSALDSEIGIASSKPCGSQDEETYEAQLDLVAAALERQDYSTLTSLLTSSASSILPLKNTEKATRLLCLVADFDHAAIVRLFLRRSGDAHARQSVLLELAALQHAIRNRQLAAAIALIEMGAIARQPRLAVNALIQACRARGTRIVWLLLTKGVDPNVADSTGVTPLGIVMMHSGLYTATQLLDVLLVYGAKATGRDANATPILEAVLRQQNGLLSKLLRRGRFLVDLPTTVGTVSCTRQITPLYMAVSLGRLAATEALIKAGADVNHQTTLLNLIPDEDHIDTYVTLAARCRSLAGLQLLLEAGADPNAVPGVGMSPLHIVVDDPGGDIALVRALLSHGADPNIPKPGDGLMPLHVAAFAGRTDVAAALLDAGADVNAPNKFGRTPFTQAAWGSSLPMLRLLIARGADAARVLPRTGSTALHTASEAGELTIVEFLVDGPGLSVEAAPAVPGRETPTGYAPLHAAAAYGHTQVVRWLCGRGADPTARMDPGVTELCFEVEKDIGRGSVAEVAAAYGHAETAAAVEELVAAADIKLGDGGTLGSEGESED